MQTTHTSLSTTLLKGLQNDCRSLYPGEYSEIDMFFSTLIFLSSSEDGCLEMSKVGKAIETSLITGDALKLPLSVFNKCKTGTALPACGYFLFSRVFHVATKEPLIRYLASDKLFATREYEDTCTDYSYQNRLCQEQLSLTGLAVFLLRQCLLIHSKRNDLPTIAVEGDEISAFIQRVTRVPEITTHRAVMKAAREYLRRIFWDEDHDTVVAPIAQWCANPFGKHGPGAVFDGEKRSDKWNFCASINAWITHPEFVDPTTAASAAKCRLSVVPKDFRKHRLICIEQKELMFYQQGLRTVFEFIVHSNPLIARSVSFDDQSKNFDLSKDLSYSTIDLADASDLVSLPLVKRLFPKEVYKLLVNGRSAFIVLPDSSELSYKTMFTMGNALCFLTETIVFASLVCAAISCYSGKSLNWASRRFRVFGDDLIVDSKYFEIVREVLLSAGLVVNQEKTCHNTPVRESCGSWFYSGVDVRIFRPATMQIVSDADWLGWLQIIKNLASMGLLTTADTIADSLSSYFPVPKGYFGIPGDRKVTRMSTFQGEKIWRWNSKFQREEFFVPAFQADERSRLAGRRALYAYFTRQATTFCSGLKTTRTWIPLE